MTLKATIRSMDEVAAYLPFHVDDVDQANEAFLRWHDTGDPRDLRLVELWTYCYTRRYFIAKFLRDSAYSSTDLDQLVSKTFTQVRDNLEGVTEPERFASWVSVICRNAFLNFVRRYREPFAIDESRLPQSTPHTSEHDRQAARRAVERAIRQLPTALQEVARLRFLEDRPYDYISDSTGRPIPSVRAYVHKATVRLREDPTLRVFLREIVL